MVKILDHQLRRREHSQVISGIRTEPGHEIHYFGEINKTFCNPVMTKLGLMKFLLELLTLKLMRKIENSLMN